MRRITNLNTTKIDKILWKVNSSLTYIIDTGILTIPKGFITDGASCPKILWSLCSPMSGPQVEGAILHDFLYSKDSDVLGLKFNRKTVDDLFYDAMILEGTKKWRAKLIYLGVRIGGNKSYKACYSRSKRK